MGWPNKLEVLFDGFEVSKRLQIAQTYAENCSKVSTI